MKIRSLNLSFKFSSRSWRGRESIVQEYRYFKLLYYTSSSMISIIVALIMKRVSQTDSS